MRDLKITVQKLCDALADQWRAEGVPISEWSRGFAQATDIRAGPSGITATVFMPQDSPMAKVEAARGYGARVELAGALGLAAAAEPTPWGFAGTG